jgi:ATP-dependent DNA helicase Q1
VCNALLDGRDVVCVMPTAGGKSLTYQLVALLTPGCTLVISPLISLMMDQIEHLHEVGVEAVMMTASTPPEVAKQIERRLLSANSSRSNAGDSAKDIKLFYVTVGLRYYFQWT